MPHARGKAQKVYPHQPESQAVFLWRIPLRYASFLACAGPEFSPSTSADDAANLAVNYYPCEVF